MIGYIFTNLLALAGVAYGWINPFFGLMVYYTFAVLRPTSLWFWSWDPYNQPRYSFYLALATMAGWLYVGMGSFKGLRKARLALAGLWVYFLAGIFSTYVTGISSEWSGQWLYVQMTIVIMLTLAMSLIRSPGQVQTFAWIITACSGYMAWVLNSQYKFDGFNRIYWKGFGNADNNGAAMMFVMMVPLSFFMAIYDKRLWVKALCMLGALLEIHVVLLSYSRGGQLGLILVGMAIFLLALIGLPRKGLTIFLAILFVVVTLQLAGEQVRHRFWTIFAEKEQLDESAASRFETWSGGIRCMMDHPLGVGPRGFNLISHQYGLPPNKSIHNLFIQTGADYGIAGMIGLFIFFSATIWQSFMLAFNPVARRLVWPRYYGQMACIALSGMMLCSVFIGMESVEFSYIVALLGLATVCYVDRVKVVELEVERHPPLELAQLLPAEERLAPA